MSAWTVHQAEMAAQRASDAWIKAMGSMDFSTLSSKERELAIQMMPEFQAREAAKRQVAVAVASWEDSPHSLESSSSTRQHMFNLKRYAR